MAIPAPVTCDADYVRPVRHSTSDRIFLFNDRSGDWLIDNRPKHPQRPDGFSELLEIDGLDAIGIRAQPATLIHIRPFALGEGRYHGIALHSGVSLLRPPHS